MVGRSQRRALERRYARAERKGTVKTIRYEDAFRGATGQPYMIPDPDIVVQKAARDKAKAEGKDSYDAPLIEASFRDAIVWFCNNIPHDQGEDGKSPRKLTPTDMGNAYAVIKAFQGQKNGSVTMEDEAYRWLMELNQTDGPIAFRVTQAVVAERLAALVPDKGTVDSEGGK